MRLFVFSLVSALLFLAGCATTDLPAREASGDFAGLAEAIANERRGEDSARDAYRHPEVTLRFFDVQPNHTVAEYAPGGGWYTKILAPYVGKEGRYVALSFSGDQTGIPRLVELLATFEEGYASRVQEMSGVPADRVSAWFTANAPEEAHGTVDRIIVPRMVHNLLRWNIANEELRAMRKLLKDDGLVGVVQHRAKPDSAWEYGEQACAILPPNAVLTMTSRPDEWRLYSVVLYMHEAEEGCADVEFWGGASGEMIQDALDAGRPVYAVVPPPRFGWAFQIQHEAPLYRVNPS